MRSGLAIDSIAAGARITWAAGLFVIHIRVKGLLRQLAPHVGERLV
jgi:hypothetical protein